MSAFTSLNQNPSLFAVEYLDVLRELLRSRQVAVGGARRRNDVQPFNDWRSWGRIVGQIHARSIISERYPDPAPRHIGNKYDLIEHFAKGFGRVCGMAVIGSARAHDDGKLVQRFAALGERQDEVLEHLSAEYVRSADALGWSAKSLYLNPTLYYSSRELDVMMRHPGHTAIPHGMKVAIICGNPIDPVQIMGDLMRQSKEVKSEDEFSDFSLSEVIFIAYNGKRGQLHDRLREISSDMAAWRAKLGDAVAPSGLRYSTLRYRGEGQVAPLELFALQHEGIKGPQ